MARLSSKPIFISIHEKSMLVLVTVAFLGKLSITHPLHVGSGNANLQAHTLRI